MPTRLFRNLPNLLSAIRLILAPIVAWSIWSRDFRQAAVLVFIAGATDALDGFLARHFSWQSRLGAYIDPLADKLLLVLSYLALGASAAVPAWLVWLVLGRDVLILIMVGIAFRFTAVRTFPPSLLGKASTAVQVLTALVVIVDRAYVSLDYRFLEQTLIALTAAATLGSGLHYLWFGFSRFPAARRARLNQ